MKGRKEKEFVCLAHSCLLISFQQRLHRSESSSANRRNKVEIRGRSSHGRTKNISNGKTQDGSNRVEQERALLLSFCLQLKKLLFLSLQPVLKFMGVCGIGQNIFRPALRNFSQGGWTQIQPGDFQEFGSCCEIIEVCLCSAYIHLFFHLSFLQKINPFLSPLYRLSLSLPFSQ